MIKTLLLAVLLLLPLPAFAACGGSVTSCGADASGKKDSTAAFTAAIAATPPGGTLTIPAGTFALSSNLSITKPITIHCAGTIRPFSNPPGPTPFFMVTSGGFTFDGGNGACTFDGISTAFNNFDTAINVAGSNDFVSGVRITGIHIKNLALNLTTAPYEGISLTAVTNCTVSGNTIQNSGPNTIYGGGFGIYLQYTSGCIVSGNSGDHLGGSFINDSAGVGDKIISNKVSYITLFAFKGGYGTGITVNGAGRPGPNAFTVPDSAYARSALAPGKYINILQGGADLEGTVRNWVAGPGFLTVFMTAPMAGSPNVGSSIEPLLTSATYSGNSCTWTGDNCYDINGWHDITNTNTTCRYAGEYKPTGAPFNGLATCIWLGYDPQEPAGTYRGQLAHITGTDADHVGGVGIMVTEGVGHVFVDNYKLLDINENNKGGSEGCGISLNPLNTNPNSRGGDLHIGRGTVTGSTPNACLAWIENSDNDSIDGLTGSATNGIVIDAGATDTVQNTVVTATGTAAGTAAFIIGAGGGNHENGVVFRNNRGTLTASSFGGGQGAGFRNDSPANSSISVDGSNSVSAPNAPPSAFLPRAGF
jgi:hypothetical protein